MIDQNSEPFASLVHKKFNVLDGGSVTLVDCFGTDADIVAAARKSYKDGSKRVSTDRDLIRYMLRHHHSTPFERCEIVLELVIPNGDTWRQMIRHRSASIQDESSMFDEPTVNAFSFRYGETPTEFHRTAPDAWRAQSKDNKQGSAGIVTLYPGSPAGVGRNYAPDFSPGEYLSRREEELLRLSEEVYRERVAFGVAYEQARKDLPNSIFTTAQWKCDLRNVLGFLALRMDGHAQSEIRNYAQTIAFDIVKPLFPLTFEAFQDFQINSMSLSALDQLVIRRAMEGHSLEEVAAGVFVNARERRECLEKLARLGIENNAKS